MQTAIHLSRGFFFFPFFLFLIYRGVVLSAARFQSHFSRRRSCERSERCSLLEPRTDRPGKDSSFLRTMVLDKEEGE